jgi:hypothetical protein
MVRHAWENMLRDSGLQYNFLSYADVIESGEPSHYKVLILPACLCLSDTEVRRIEDFCRRGGTVIADYMPGLWGPARQRAQRRRRARCALRRSPRSESASR